MSVILKPTLGSQLNLGHRLSQGLVGYWLFNEGSGNIVSDLSGNGKNGTLTGMPWVNSKHGSAIRQSSNGDEINISNNPLTISAGSDFTYIWAGTIEDWVGANSGLWRDASNSQGGTFNIWQGDTGRPWIRLNTVNILKPLSGFGVPLNEFITVAFVVKSGTWAGWYFNGILKHEASHATATPTFTIYQFGWQTTVGERIKGNWSHQSFYNRALPASEIAELSIRPFGMFDRTPIELWVGATSVGVPAVGQPTMRRWANIPHMSYLGRRSA